MPFDFSPGGHKDPQLVDGSCTSHGNKTNGKVVEEIRYSLTLFAFAVRNAQGSSLVYIAPLVVRAGPYRLPYTGDQSASRPNIIVNKLC